MINRTGLPPWAKLLTDEEISAAIAEMEEDLGQALADWDEELSDVVESTSVHLLATLRAVEAERDKLRALLQQVVEDDKFLPSIKKGLKSRAEGRMVAWSDVKKELGLDAALQPAPEKEA